MNERVPADSGDARDGARAVFVSQPRQVPANRIVRVPLLSAADQGYEEASARDNGLVSSVDTKKVRQKT